MRTLLLDPDDRLRKICSEVKTIDGYVIALANELRNFVRRGPVKLKDWELTPLGMAAPQLGELIQLAIEYYRWRYECFEVINAEVRAQGKQFSTLNDVFSLVFGSDLEGMFGGTEGSASYNIYKAIYKGELTFDMAKESILKGSWDREIVIQGKNVMFKDIIDGGDFHKFIESLRKLQNRTSIKTLRNAQAAFLQRAQSLLKEVS